MPNDEKSSGLIDRHLRHFKDAAIRINRFLFDSPRLIGSYLIHGLIIIIPLAVTIWLLIWFFNLIDGILGPVLEWLFGRPIPGLGFLIIIALVILIGLLGVRIGQRKFFDFAESRIMKIPVVGTIYGSTRQILNSFNTTNDNFLEVVFMEFPRKGIHTVGLVTSEVKDRNGKKVLNVFIPTAPNPTSGFLQIVPESDVIKTTMSVDEAMKLIISAGKISHKDIADMLLQVPEAESN
ncbi:DUF502 domain-containing protein [Chloroflexota bacterium]